MHPMYGYTTTPSSLVSCTAPCAGFWEDLLRFEPMSDLVIWDGGPSPKNLGIHDHPFPLPCSYISLKNQDWTVASPNIRLIAQMMMTDDKWF